MRMTPNPIKKFLNKFTHSFCKLGPFSAMGRIVYNNEMVQLTKKGA